MEDFEIFLDTDNCSIQKILSNNLGKEFLQDFTEAWNRNFSKINYFDLNKYETGQLNGFVMGFVEAWKKYNT